jgi:hypothetical protein
MFVIVHNNSVVLGPMRWNRHRFENFLAEEIEINYTLPTNNEIAITILPEVRILPIQTTPNPAYNPKIEMLYGPIWEFTDSSAISSYEVRPIAIDAVKNMLKEQVAGERYFREITTVDVTINDTVYKFSTNRETRNVIQNALTASVSSFNWKMDRDTWVTLTNTELQAILDAITAHVQSCFDWEYSTIAAINACTTSDELDAIVIVEPRNAVSEVV